MGLHLPKLFGRSRATKKNARLEAAPKPSELYTSAVNVDRATKRAHKMMLRRAYRNRSLTGIMPSNQRQILGESLGRAEFERKERQAEEDARYGAAGP